MNALVGSPQTIAAALSDYVQIGVAGFRLHVLDIVEDTQVVGSDILPLVRDDVSGMGEARQPVYGREGGGKDERRP